jgi:hypothetical protein
MRPPDLPDTRRVTDDGVAVSIGVPMDAELWTLTRAAVQAAGSAADAHLASGGYRPRVALPQVDTFDSGWPRITKTSALLAPEAAPTNYSALFGAQRDVLHPFAYEDVTEVAQLLDYVRGRDDLRSRLTVASPSGDGELLMALLDFETTRFALSLLDRARAIDATGPDDLLPLYLERERAWLADPLPVEYVVPLALTALDLDGALVIDATTRIERMDAGTQAARASDDSPLSTVPSTVAGAATHAIVLSGHHIANPGPIPRIFGRATAEAPPLEEADFVCQALRIVTDVDVGYAQVLLRPLGWADRWEHDLPALTPVDTVRRYPDHFDNYGWLRTPQTITADALQQLPTVVAALRSTSQNVALAARRLSLAALREADEDRTVDACIGLEALLGEGRDELTHRLALRAATALTTSPDRIADPRALYGLVKKVYSHRSDVVHGNVSKVEKSRLLDFEGRKYRAADVAVTLLRELLTDVLTRPGGWTAKSLDIALLDALRPPAALDTPTDDKAISES